MLFANVIVDISHEKLDKTFQYIIPKELENKVMAGCQVDIPFGRGDRQISGYVIEIEDKPCMDVSRLKEIKGLSKKSLMIESQLIALAGFIKERYGSTMNKALKTVIPIKQSIKGKEKKYLKLKVTKEEAQILYENYKKRKNTKGRAELLNELINTESIEYELVIAKLAISDQIIKGLEKQNIIEIDRTAVYRNPVGDYGTEEDRVCLNDEQKRVTEDIIADIDSEKGNTHLIFGVYSPCTVKRKRGYSPNSGNLPDISDN